MKTKHYLLLLKMSNMPYMVTHTINLSNWGSKADVSLWFLSQPFGSPQDLDDKTTFSCYSRYHTHWLQGMEKPSCYWQGSFVPHTYLSQYWWVLFNFWEEDLSTNCEPCELHEWSGSQEMPVVETVAQILQW